MSELTAQPPLRELLVGRAAIHESGHALAAVAFGFFTLASILEGGGGVTVGAGKGDWRDMLVIVAGDAACRIVPSPGSSSRRRCCCYSRSTSFR